MKTTTTTQSRWLPSMLAVVLAIGLLFMYTLPAAAQLESRSDRTNTESEKEEVRTDNSEADADGIDDGTEERANYNNSRSNRATVVGEDGGDVDGDGYGDVRQAPDYNDPDDDGDGVPTQVDRADRNESNLEFVRTRRQQDNATDTPARTNIVKKIDKASPRIRALRGIDKATPALYERIRTSGALCPVEDCDDQDEDVRPDAEDRRRHALRVAVSGEEVRGASEEAKEEVRARLQAADEINDANDFGIRVALAAIDNEAITDIESDDEQTTVRFRTPARILGIFPTQLQARIEATADGERVRYPWYAFLASKEEQASLRELAAELRANHDSILSAAVEESEEE